jgi:hypothetical protein
MSFEDLVGGDDLLPEEEARLRRVHELLVQAGPPPDLPPSLEHPSSAPEDADVIRLPLPRRAAVAAIAAAAAVAAGFGIGYAVGHSKTKPAQFTAERVVTMHGRTPGRFAVLRIGHQDSVGNWPMELTVTGLPEQRSRGAYYDLWLTKHGRPAVSCGVFRAHGGTTTVRLSVPYRFSQFGGWIVTAEGPRDGGTGAVVLTT